MRTSQGYFWLMVLINAENIIYYTIQGFMGNLPEFRIEVVVALFLPLTAMLITGGDEK
jgi:hypothetical protein